MYRGEKDPPGPALKDKVCLITGAARGLGRGFALSMAGHGADVALLDRAESELEAVAAPIRELGRRAIEIGGDVRIEADVKRAVETSTGRLGTIDVLVNCAGVGDISPVSDMPVELWDKIINTNLRGTFLCCKYVLPVMIGRQRGSIINIASGGRGLPALSAYFASKFAVVALTQSLAAEVAPHGIAVNCVRFGDTVDTELARQVNPGADRSQWVRPEDVTDFVVWLATQDASGVTGGYINRLEWLKQIGGPLPFALTPAPAALRRVNGEELK